LLALRYAIDDDQSFPIAIGAHFGSIFVGSVGAPGSRAYGVIGDAVNTAARVASKANVGQLLATEVCVEATLTAFTYQPVAPFAVKGKRHPIRAGAVGSVIGPRAQSHDGPTVGREAEVALLRRIVHDSKRMGRVVVVEAPAGVGKSHLTHEVVAGLEGFRLGRVMGGRYASMTPYRAVAGWLHDVIGGTSPTHLARFVEQTVPAYLPLLPLLGSRHCRHGRIGCGCRRAASRPCA
jgi:hypothetical protein